MGAVEALCDSALRRSISPARAPSILNQTVPTGRGPPAYWNIYGTRHVSVCSIRHAVLDMDRIGL